MVIMKEIRMCISCRTKRNKFHMLRLFGNSVGIQFDSTGKKTGRGFYVCANSECVSMIQKKKIFNKIFKKNVNDSIYKMVQTLSLLSEEGTV